MCNSQTIQLQWPTLNDTRNWSNACQALLMLALLAHLCIPHSPKDKANLYSSKIPWKWNENTPTQIRFHGTFISPNWCTLYCCISRGVAAKRKRKLISPKEIFTSWRGTRMKVVPLDSGWHFRRKAQPKYWPNISWQTEHNPDYKHVENTEIQKLNK